MRLTFREMVLAKNALSVLEAVGPQGLSEGALLEQCAMRSEALLTTVEGRALMKVLVEKRWIERCTDPLTGVERWWLTEDGRLAVRAL